MKSVLIVILLLACTPIYADTCEQKWAKYYAGKSWFKPWCDTASYKRKKEDARYFDNDEQVETHFTRYEKNRIRARRVNFDQPTFLLPTSCKARLKRKKSNYIYCIDIFGKITFNPPQHKNDPTSDESEINSVILKCDVKFTLVNKATQDISKLYKVSTGNVFSEFIQENQARSLKLIEVEYYTHWKYPNDKERTRVVHGAHTINLKKSEGG
jgi:hypothetical protein